MEVVGFVIGVLGPVQQAVETLQLIIECEEARRNNPKRVSDLRKLYEDFVEKLQQLKREYDGRLCDLPPAILKVFEGHWDEMQQCFDRAEQILTELYGKLQKLSVVGNFLRAMSTAEKIESLKKDLQRADQRLAGVNAILATATITRKEVDRVMRHTSKKLDGLSEKIDRVAGASGQQRDSFHACFIVPLNPPHVTLKFATAGEGTPPTREATVKISVLKQKSDSPMFTVLKGGGGLGKTCTLRGLARQGDVKERFKDGIYYLSLGKDASEQTVIKEVCKAIRLSGGRATAAALEKTDDLRAVVEEAKEWFQGKKFLVLTDDIWDRVIDGPRVVLLLLDLISAGDDSGLVITTRDGGLAEIGQSQTVVEFEARDPLGAEARAMLLSCAGFQESDIRDRASEEAIEALLRICGGFPVTLAVAGKGVSVLASTFRQAERANAWVEYRSTEKACREKIVDESVRGYDSSLVSIVTTTLSVVEESLGEEVRSEMRYTAWEMFQGLCVLQKQVWVPVSVAQKLWSMSRLKDAQGFMEKLGQWSLATVSYEEFEGVRVMGMRIHDLLLDIVLMKAGEQVAEWHAKLLSGYECMQGEDGESSTTNASREWASERFRDDHYFHSQVIRHLVYAGLHDEALELVTNPQWTARQFELSGLLQLEQDVSAVKACFSTEECARADREALIDGLELVAGAARFSFGHGYSCASDLYFQMCGRLVGEAQGSEVVCKYVAKIGMVAEEPWLRPMRACLTVPGGGSQGIVSCKTAVWCIELLENDVKVLCGCFDGRILVVDMVGGTVVGEWKAHDFGVECIAVTSDRKRIVSGGWDGTVKIWDVETGAQMGTTMAGHEGGVTRVAIAARDDWSVSGSEDGTMRVWDLSSCSLLRSMRVRRRWRKKRGRIACVAVTPDGGLIVSGGEDGTVRVWSVETGKMKWTRSPGKIEKGDIKEVRFVAIVNDGKHVVSCLEDMKGTVTFWDLVSGQRDGDRIETKVWPERAAVSCDGNRIVVSSVSGDFCVLDTETQEEVARGRVGTGSDSVQDVKLAADGTKVLSCSRNGTLRLLDVASGAATSSEAPARGHSSSDVVGDHERDVWSVAVTPDEENVVAGYRDGRMRVLDVHTGQPIGDPFEGHDSSVSGIAVTPDGRRVVSVSRDKTVRVWDFESRQQISAFEDHEDDIKCVAVIPAGDKAVTGSHDKTVRVWNLLVDGGECVILRGHSSWVERVCVSGNGRRIISASWDDEVRVWDMETASCVKVVSCEDAFYVPDQELIMAAGESVRSDEKGAQVRCHQRQIYMGSTDARLVLATLENHVRDWAFAHREKMLVVVLKKGLSREMFRFKLENEAEVDK